MGGALGEGLTVGVLQNGQRSVAVLVVGELVVVQTLVELVGTDQSRRPGRRICSHESRVRGREPRRGGGRGPSGNQNRWPDSRIRGFHLMVGSWMMSLSEAMALDGNLSVILTEDWRYSWPWNIPGEGPGVKGEAALS